MSSIRPDLLGRTADQAAPYVRDVMGVRRSELRAEAGLVARAAWPLVWSVLLAVAPIVARIVLEWVALRLAEAPALGEDLRTVAIDLPPDVQETYRIHQSAWHTPP